MKKTLPYTEDEKKVLKQLKTIIDPDYDDNIVDLGFISHLKVDNGKVFFHLHLPEKDAEKQRAYQQFAEETVLKLKGIQSVSIIIDKPAQKSSLDASANGLEKVKNIIAVASCKGGVGKSTVAVNLAYALKLMGHHVGLFDADVYGPSLPTMVKPTTTELEVNNNEGLIPLEASGIKLMSFGFAGQSDPNQTAAIMRGPMVSQVINQLITGTDWGTLDYLVIDLPPGTGDVQLTLGQLIPLTASILVTTPQELSFIDVEKGIQMFNQLNVETIAVVENMSYFICDNCDKKHQIFGEGALKKIKKQYGLDKNFILPMTPDLTIAGDTGNPIMITNSNKEIVNTFQSLAKTVQDHIEEQEKSESEAPIIGYQRGHGLTLHYPSTQKPPKIITEHTLRSACRCAKCIEEFTGKNIIKKETLEKELEIINLKPIGNYAIGIEWADLHSSLYPIKQLNELCKHPETAQERP